MANLTFAQYIVFAEEMYESAVNDNAEDFPKVAVHAYPPVIIRANFLSTFVDLGDQSWVPNIGEDARADDDIKEFKYSQLELWSGYYTISFKIPSTPQAFGLE
jgi:hypothetical protein